MGRQSSVQAASHHRGTEWPSNRYAHAARSRMEYHCLARQCSSADASAKFARHVILYYALAHSSWDGHHCYLQSSRATLVGSLELSCHWTAGSWRAGSKQTLSFRLRATSDAWTPRTATVRLSSWLLTVSATAEDVCTELHAVWAAYECVSALSTTPELNGNPNEEHWRMGFKGLSAQTCVDA